MAELFSVDEDVEANDADVLVDFTKLPAKTNLKDTLSIYFIWLLFVMLINYL